MLIAIEGIDGVGKGTQSALLYERLKSQLNCRLLGFPAYSSFFGSMISDYLNGEFGPLTGSQSKLSILLYAMDRWKALENIDINEYDVVVCDRYVPSNLAHQGAKVSPDKRSMIIDWIEELEYKILANPVPDLVILLDATIDTASAQILRKAKRAYTDKKKDLHESDDNYLEKVRVVYRDLAEVNSYYELIECDSGGIMRTVDEIHEEIWQRVRHNCDFDLK